MKQTPCYKCVEILINLSSNKMHCCYNDGMEPYTLRILFLSLRLEASALRLEVLDALSGDNLANTCTIYACFETRECILIETREQ